jgi:uncharacterized protein YjlB
MTSSSSSPSLSGVVEVTALLLTPRDFLPNNVRLPVLVYARPLAGAADLAQSFETRFGQNGWPAQWRDSIYDFHHYHSEGHEVLGIAAGTAKVMLGGPGGHVVDLSAGDVPLLPAGTGHCRLEASDDLLVVGAYPPGQSGDIRREPADAAVMQRIARLSFPVADPVFGRDGPLTRHWSDTLDARP